MTDGCPQCLTCRRACVTIRFLCRRRRQRNLFLTMDRQQSRVPWVTPSATPPATRSSFASSSRNTDLPPPLKRQRLSSTASSTPASEQVDVEGALRASTNRLLDTWSQLAERYYRRLDEDDIVDLVTGDVVKDRGVLRSMPTRWEFGRFAGEDGGELWRSSRPQTPSNEEEDCDSDDELDTLSPSKPRQRTEEDSSDAPDVSVSLSRTFRPIGRLNPNDEDDAEDLREFMAGEAQRREMFGSEPEDSVGQDSDFERISQVGEEGEEQRFDDASSTASGFQDPQELSPVADFSVPNFEGTFHDYLTFAEDSDSDDEIAIWDDREASAVRVLNEQEYNDTDDLESSPPPRSSPTPLPKTHSRPLTCQSGAISRPAQLLTPPYSHTSSSISPYDDTLPLSSPPPSSSSEALAERSKTPKASHPSNSPMTISPTVPRLDLSQMSVKTPKRRNGPSRGQADSSTPSAVKQRPSTPSNTAVRAKTRSHSYSGTMAKDELPTAGKKMSQHVIDLASASEDESDDPVGMTSAPMLHPRRTSSASRLHDFSRSRQSRPSSRFDSRRSDGRENASSDDEAPVVSQSSSPAQRPGPQGQIVEVVIPRRALKRKRASTLSPEQPLAGPSKPVTVKGSRSEERGRSRSQARSAALTHSLDDHPEKHEPPIRHQSKSRSKSKPRHHHSPEDSEDSDPDSHNRRFRRAGPSSSHTYHHPLPTFNSEQHPPQLPLLYDPRAQYILTQTMQQLLALSTGGWPHPGAPQHTYPFPAPHSMPYTPRHHSSIPSSLYSTPMHRDHPYPQSYDPAFSHATLPPSSPDPDSSPVPARGEGKRASSLVARSRSRGRRVSFHIEDQGSDEDDSPSKGRNLSKGKQPQRPPRPPKGEVRDVSDSESELELEHPPIRGRKFERAQTPGPPPSRSRSLERPPARKTRAESTNRATVAESSSSLRRKKG